MPRRHTDADECAGCLFLFIPTPPPLFFFFYFSITCWQRYCFIFCLQDPPVLLMSWKNINENSLDSIFAPYGFAEAVAPLKQSAVPSGHCGFCPLPVCRPPPPPFAFTYCRSVPPQLENSLTKHPEGVSLGGRRHENGRSPRLAQPLLASSPSTTKEKNKGRGNVDGDEFGVSNNVRRIDSEGSASVAHPSRSGRSLFLSRSGGMGPNPGACHSAQINWSMLL